MSGDTPENNVEMADVSVDEVGDEFPVGTTVLAKLKGFPAWPAVVVRDSDVAESVQAVRPKKKHVYPVLFYNDHNYMWAAPSELKVLSPEEAAKNASKPKLKRGLRDAFNIAADPPSLDDYLAAQKQPVDVEVVEEVVEKEPAPKRAKRAAEKPVAPSRVTRKSGRKRAEAESSEPASRRKNAKGEKGEQGEKPEVEEQPESSDVEGGDVEDVHVDGDNVPRIELRGPKPRGRPSAKKTKATPRATLQDVEQSSELRNELCLQVRFRLQKGFLSGETPTAAQLGPLSAYLAQLEEVPNFEVSLIRATKINRVLKAIIKLKTLPKDEYQFAERCSALLERWNTPAEPVIRGRPEGEVADEDIEASVEPEPYSEDASLRETSELGEPVKQEADVSGDLAEVNEDKPVTNGHESEPLSDASDTKPLSNGTDLTTKDTETENRDTSSVPQDQDVGVTEGTDSTTQGVGTSSRTDSVAQDVGATNGVDSAAQEAEANGTDSAA